MEIYEVTFSHDTSDKKRVATVDGPGGFESAFEWAKEKCKQIRKELQDDLPKKERNEVEEVQIMIIEYQYQGVSVAKPLRVDTK